MLSPTDNLSGKSIAILPFLNMSSDPENEYFSDGLTEEIINALTRVEGLNVTARTSSFAFKSKNIDVRQIGAQLGVATILEGSVRIAKEKVRITAQLVKVADGFHLWSETFDRPLKDVFALQDEISLRIADKLREDMGHLAISDQLVDAPKVSVAIYKRYLKGKYHVQKMNKLDVEKAFAIFQEVIDRQPNFPLPYLGMHYGYNFLGVLGIMPPAEAFAKGKFFLDRAFELDENLPECQYHLAGVCCWQKWDLKGTYQRLTKALELRPGYADAHQFMAAALVIEGKFGAALNYLETALKLDPFAAINHYYKGVVFYLQENFQQAIPHFEKSLSLEPHFIFSNIIWAASLLKMGRIEEGMLKFQKLPTAGEADMSKTGGVTLAYAMQGNEKKTREGIKRLQSALQTDVGGRALFFLILIHTALGKREEALNLLEKGVKQKLPILIMLNVEPFFKPLRSHPRFRKLAKLILGEAHWPVFPKKKYKKSSLKPEEAKRHFQDLERYMMKEKPYLDSNLTLRRLAELIAVHPNHLSQLLNEQAHKNFSEYVNTYRLEAFKIKIVNPANRHLTILALAYESGFNSKTVFNTFFKKAMGKTPREYWREVGKIQEGTRR